MLRLYAYDLFMTIAAGLIVAGVAGWGGLWLALVAAGLCVAGMTQLGVGR